MHRTFPRRLAPRKCELVYQIYQIDQIIAILRNFAPREGFKLVFLPFSV